MIRRALLLFLGLAAMPVAARAERSMAFFHTAGPAADPITRLGWGLGIISILVIIIIALLLLGGIFRRRAPLSETSYEQLAVHRDAGGLSWIYIGVGVSIPVLIVCMVWTLVTTAAVIHPRVSPTVTIDVTASQWWWGLRYDNRDPARVFTTANEIHIPVGQPVRIELASADVIHSFWIPKLAGKMDVIPGQTNVMWLQADQPGIYRGQCAVFCGAEHARMALQVVAESPGDFVAWQDHQLSVSDAPQSALAQQGAAVFETRCGACHSVRGTGAGGLVGPDLTHLMSRSTLAAGLLPNTPGNLAGWISDAQALKPGSRMPNLMLAGPELSAVMAYLNTLR